MAAFAIVNRRALRRLQAGHPWIFRSDIASLPDGDAGVVEVCDPSKAFLGLALYSPRSTITLRLLSRERLQVDRELLLSRLRAATARRQRFVAGRDAYRVVHGEADLLPGVFVDKYGDAVVLQTTCAGAASLERDLVAALEEVLRPRLLVIRNDAASRRHEGLPQEARIAVGGAPTTVAFHEGDVALEIDVLTDQKTGAFLDQSANHLRAGEVAAGEGLDLFTYHGGFALQLAKRCTRVTAVDQSQEALERGRANAGRAGRQNIEWVRSNVLELLPRLVASGAQFDTVVLDPPAFASTAATEARALRAYKDVNLRAMKLVRPGGVLISCSCSGRVSAADFDAMLQAAARDARRSVQIVERRGAGADHPVLCGVPETEYLKCRVCAVL
ncbi:MAG: class I SAM-dependent rRNA methyltransferase [Deltaproteobacteria bacterium]|nr:class I SAM-dependent rRNA methyltransferase [Deltaproteobacteria bacterium]